MDSKGKHQRDVSATDQKNRTDDEHILELDKQHLKESERNAGPIPTQGDKGGYAQGKKGLTANAPQRGAFDWGVGSRANKALP